LGSRTYPYGEAERTGFLIEKGPHEKDSFLEPEACPQWNQSRQARTVDKGTPFTKEPSKQLIY